MTANLTAAGKKKFLFQNDLKERLGWLIRLRWLAALGVGATVLVSREAKLNVP